MLLGRPAPLDTPDRRVLEGDILAAIASCPEFRRVLFVGCDWYTAHYGGLLPGLALTTLDPERRRARFGASRHVIDTLQNLELHFEPASFDVIVCNGVYGWGLDRRDDCERAFAACATRLRPDGLFVLGWNDVRERDPAPLSEVALSELEPCAWPPLGATRFLVEDSDERHTYAFYRRAAANRPSPQTA